MKSFPEKFLCFNRYMHTGSWFSLMPVDSSHVIQYDEEFGWETGPSTHTLECSENLPDFHGEAFGRRLRLGYFGGGSIWLTVPTVIRWQRKKAGSDSVL